MKVESTFEPKPKEDNEFPAHFRCVQAPSLVILALSKRVIIMIQKTSTLRSEPEGSLIDPKSIASLDNEEVWERIPGKSNLTFETD